MNYNILAKWACQNCLFYLNDKPLHDAIIVDTRQNYAVTLIRDIRPIKGNAYSTADVERASYRKILSEVYNVVDHSGLSFTWITYPNHIAFNTRHITGEIRPATAKELNTGIKPKVDVEERTDLYAQRLSFANSKMFDIVCGDSKNPPNYIYLDEVRVMAHYYLLKSIISRDVYKKLLTSGFYTEMPMIKPKPCGVDRTHYQHQFAEWY